MGGLFTPQPLLLPHYAIISALWKLFVYTLFNPVERESVKIRNREQPINLEYFRHNPVLIKKFKNTMARIAARTIQKSSRFRCLLIYVMYGVCCPQSANCKSCGPLGANLRHVFTQLLHLGEKVKIGKCACSENRISSNCTVQYTTQS